MLDNTANLTHYIGLIFDVMNISCGHTDTTMLQTYASPCHIYYLYQHKHVIKYDLIKTLSESLVLSHLTYFLPVWKPSLSNFSPKQRKYMQNWAVHLCKSLCKYDHISHHYHSLSWLPYES